MTSTSSPDSLVTWTTSDPQSLPAASAAMMGSVQAALSKRQVNSYKWTNDAARTGQTGMTEGDLGDQADTNVIWRYDGAAWQPLISPSSTYPVTMQGVSAVGNGTLAATYSRVGKMVTVEGSLRVGSTTTFNSSNFAVSLPVDADPKYTATSTFEFVVGRSGVLNPGVIAYSGPVVLRGDNNGFANVKTVAIFNGAVVDALIKQGAPITFASGQLVSWSFTYQAA